MTRRADLLKRRARLPSGVTCDVISSDDRGVYVEWRDTGRREWETTHLLVPWSPSISSALDLAPR